jgi:rhamnogalacturonan endolyase
MTTTATQRTFMPARWAVALAIALTALFGANIASAQSAGVKVTEDAELFTLSNDVIVATVSKRTGDLVSLTYKGTETLTPDAGGHSAAYWSHDATGGKDVVTRVTIDPAKNGGERAEVSVKGISGGIKMGHGPGSATTGDIPLDIDTRWSLGRGDHGVYTYVAFEHRPEYGSASMTEARIAVELQDYFDNIHVDALRSGKYPIDMGGIPGDKYAYTTRQKDERATGWTSSTKHLGWFLINPSTEYLSGGPNKAEFVAHKEPSPGPAVLNYWRSSHYGGANVTVSEGERWIHVVGPFMFYINEGASHQAMVADAQAQLKKEEAKWPYGWVDAPGYAKPAERSTVTGQIALDDRYAPDGGRFTGKLMVGLTRTPYQIPRLGGPAAQAGAPTFQTIEWQNDANLLQHWSKNLDPSGRFTIEKVPPGAYTLFAYADGVLGEYSKADVTVPAGGKVDLGKLVWTPVRYGRTVWEVGTADRDPREFAYADHFFQPASQLKYTEMFPQGVVYRIGRSTPGKDWFFVQAPHAPSGETPRAVVMSGISGAGEATPYRIVFDMPKAARGAATVRFAFTSYSAPGIEVSVNGTPVGIARGPGSDGAVGLHQIFGRYSETALAFDASLLKAGENTVTLTVPAGAYNNTVVYDVVRLELDEAAATPPKPAQLTLPPSGPVAPAIPIAQRLRQAPTPSQVVTMHDDARFGLPSPTVGDARYFAQGNAIMVQAGNGASRQLAAPASLDVWAVSPDGRRLAYASPDTEAADSPLTIRVVDTATGAPVDEVKWARQTAIAWTPDSKGFYYSGGNVPPPGVTTTSGGLVLHHTLGEPRTDDQRMLWSDRFGMAHYAEITDDGQWLVINGSVRADGKSEINLINLKEPKTAPFKAMRRLSERWQFAGSNGPLLYFVTDYGAERGRLVAMDTSKSSLPILEVVPEAAERLQAARLKNGQVSLSYAGASAPVIRTVGLNTLAAR